MGREHFDVEGLVALAPRPEQAALALISEASSMYVKAKYESGNLQSRLQAEKHMVHAENIIRTGAMLTALTFNISSAAASEIVERVAKENNHTYIVSNPMLKSLVAKNMAMGFIEARQPELASQLFETHVTIVKDQESIYQWLLQRDPNITVS